ncbi:MAG: hypothetical protein ACPG31_03810 [Planctomycetota bacterium]
MSNTVRLAMWSCPRTVSTALLRSFCQRPDTVGVDEPLYAHYLAATGKRHPMREEVLASQPQDWRDVVAQTLAAPCEKPVQFVKHMAHHLEGGVETDFALADDTINLFLIRHPREMLPSLLQDLGSLEAVDIGYLQQVELFRKLKAAGRAAAVVDSTELLADPETMLRALCTKVGLEFDSCMMTWPAGRHESYGIWAPAWYAKVETSTGWRVHVPKTAPFPAELEELYPLALEAYEELAAEALHPRATDHA